MAIERRTYSWMSIQELLVRPNISVRASVLLRYKLQGHVRAAATENK